MIDSAVHPVVINPGEPLLTTWTPTAPPFSANEGADDEVMRDESER